MLPIHAGLAASPLYRILLHVESRHTGVVETLSLSRAQPWMTSMYGLLWQIILQLEQS